MADEAHDTGALHPKQWKRIIAEARARAELVLETSPTCEVCHQRITTRGRRATRHWGCEPDTLAGKVCTCSPGCSEHYYGDGRRECDVACVPCKLRRGQSLTGKRRNA